MHAHITPEAQVAILAELVVVKQTLKRIEATLDAFLQTGRTDPVSDEAPQS